MTLTLHTLAPAKGARRKKFRIGRGNASGRGTTAGRGTKGQRARAGGRNRLKLKGLKQMLLSFPKQRGFTSKFPTVYAVRLGEIMQRFEAGERVDVRTLKRKELIPAKAKYAKVVGGGTADKALVFEGVMATAAVKAAVVKAGGTFRELAINVK